MNRVTIVNLAGRAWHIEDAGVQKLESWLEAARTRLAADPDRDELVLDFERAIADRLAHVAPRDRDVVTAAQVSDVLDALGTVEPADDDAAAAATTPMEPVAGPAAGAVEDPPNWRDRRLYRLTGDDALLAGVCSGLAAYLRMDVTVVRVAVVVLTILTSGAGIIAYIVMALIVPEAKSPEERAEALGTGTTAQEMLARAREQASPALATLGSFITTVAGFVAVLIRWTLLVTIWALLVAWAVAIGWIAIDPDIILDLFDEGTSAWLAGLWVTCIAWIPIALLLPIERGFAEIRRPRTTRSRPTTIALTTAWVVSVAVATLGIFAIPASYSRELSGIVDGRGIVTFQGQTICIDADHRGDDRDFTCPDSADIVLEE